MTNQRQYHTLCSCANPVFVCNEGLFPKLWVCSFFLFYLQIQCFLPTLLLLFQLVRSSDCLFFLLCGLSLYKCDSVLRLQQLLSLATAFKAFAIAWCFNLVISSTHCQKSNGLPERTISVGKCHGWREKPHLSQTTVVEHMFWWTKEPNVACHEAGIHPNKPQTESKHLSELKSGGALQFNTYLH